VGGGGGASLHGRDVAGRAAMTGMVAACSVVARKVDCHDAVEQYAFGTSTFDHAAAN
jgi:hypothetical protein